MKTLFGIPEGQEAFVLAGRAKESTLALHVALDEARINTLAELLAFFAPDIQVLTFPAWDCLPYDRVSPQGDIIGRRVATLGALAAGVKKPTVLLTSVNAITQRVIPHEAVQGHGFVIKKGGALAPGRLIRLLAEQGYVRTDVVREGGDSPCVAASSICSSPAPKIPCVLISSATMSNPCGCSMRSRSDRSMKSKVLI